jgi:NtrC-family two-component system response regulator AlgB
MSARRCNVRETCRTVLLVDDDKSILRTFSRILQRAGYQTETAESGKEALDKIHERCYDIALIDIVLGDNSGLDLLPKIKESSPKTIKIMVTGADTTERRGEAHKNGADAYLTKPVNPEMLLSVFKEKLNCN